MCIYNLKLKIVFFLPFYVLSKFKTIITADINVKNQFERKYQAI